MPPEATRSLSLSTRIRLLLWLDNGSLNLLIGHLLLCLDSHLLLWLGNLVFLLGSLNLLIDHLLLWLGNISCSSAAARGDEILVFLLLSLYLLFGHPLWCENRLLLLPDGLLFFLGSLFWNNFSLAALPDGLLFFLGSLILLSFSQLLWLDDILCTYGAASGDKNLLLFLGCLSLISFSIFRKYGAVRGTVVLRRYRCRGSVRIYQPQLVRTTIEICQLVHRRRLRDRTNDRHGIILIRSRRACIIEVGTAALTLPERHLDWLRFGDVFGHGLLLLPFLLHLSLLWLWFLLFGLDVRALRLR